MYSDDLETDNVHFMDVGGIRTRYYEAGDGPHLVLWSGGQFGGIPNSLDHWSLNLKELAKFFHVVAFDKLGQGYTDNPECESNYTFDRLLEHSLDAMDAVGVEDAHVVGHSRGALLACWIAHERPSRLKSVVICDTAPVAGYDRPASDVVTLWESLGLFRGADPHAEPTRESVSIGPRGQAYDPETVTQGLITRLLAVSQLSKVSECKLIMEEIESSIWQPSLEVRQRRNIELIRASGFPIPVLFLWGVNDKTAPLQEGLDLFKIVAEKTVDAQMHIVNHAGHYVFRDQPNTFTSVLRNFCDQDAKSRRA